MKEESRPYALPLPTIRRYPIYLRAIKAKIAGGFACLRPIALADEPVRSIAVDRGFVVINGKRRGLDSLWKNGTAAQAYWLWREHFCQVKAKASSPRPTRAARRPDEGVREPARKGETANRK